MTLQSLATFLIVAAAFAYVAWRYLPRGWRNRLVAATPPVAMARPSSGCGSGCSACSDCPVAAKARVPRVAGVS